MKFQPGQSGNPAGRPLGSLNKKTLAVEAAYEAKAEEAVNDIMERAKKGDFAAMRLCMDRAEAAIDMVMDGLAEGVLSLPDVTELLRIVDRLLQLGEIIRERKRVRELFTDRPPVQDALPEAPADGLAAGQRNGDEGVEPEGAGHEPLYFPVNSEDEGSPNPPDGPSGWHRAADSPPSVGRHAMPEPSTA